MNDQPRGEVHWPTTILAILFAVLMPRLLGLNSSVAATFFWGFIFATIGSVGGYMLLRWYRSRS